MTRYAMVVDNQRCIGCWTCSTACKLENNLIKGVWWNHIVTEDAQGERTYRTAGGTYPDNLRMQMYPVHCMHCDEPACVAACPTGATAKDPETGVVTQDTTACIGCRSCMEACPYDVRTFIEGDPGYHYEWAVGDPDAAPHRENTVEKCTFCAPKLALGENPACVDICVGRARWFGDLDDPYSEVSKLLAEREYTVLGSDKGTAPNVYYLS